MQYFWLCTAYDISSTAGYLLVDSRYFRYHNLGAQLTQGCKYYDHHEGNFLIDMGWG